MLNKKKAIYVLILVGFFIFIISLLLNNYVNNQIGVKIDEYKGVKVYYNGYIWNVEGRNQTKEGYNLGLKYQCVEFVKRYYLEQFGHKMPKSSGNAKDFFDKNVKNGEMNFDRGLVQYINGYGDKPQVDDIIVFSSSAFNKYGHVAIVSASDNQFIEIVQQNSGLFGNSREKFALLLDNQNFRVDNKQIMGWLRKKNSD